MNCFSFTFNQKAIEINVNNEGISKMRSFFNSYSGVYCFESQLKSFYYPSLEFENFSDILFLNSGE